MNPSIDHRMARLFINTDWLCTQWRIQRLLLKRIVGREKLIRREELVARLYTAKLAALELSK